MLRQENAQLRNAGTSLVVWENLAAKPSNTNAAAIWALDLHNTGRVRLPVWEQGFLGTCSTWSGRLTANMELSFQRLIEKLRRAGFTPPT